MRLTPLDIKKQEFSRGLRGYEAEEVEAFLQMVSEQWEEMLDEVRRKDEEIRDLEGKLAHYEKVEEALQEALQTARETSKKSIENAEQKASLMLERAEARADDIKRDAELELHQVKRETSKLNSRKSEIVTRLRAFLMSELELLASYEGDDPVGFIKLLPADKDRLRQISNRLEGGEPPAPEARADESEPERRSEPAKVSEYPTEETEEEVETEPEPDELDEDIPRDVTAAEHAQQHRAWGDEDDVNAIREETPPLPYEESEEAEKGPRWTTRSFVSEESEKGHAPEEDEFDEQAEADDQTTTRASSEEIEKIRRILSDLD